MKRVVTFDCYGTLIDWDTGIQEILAGILQEKKASVTVPAFHHCWESVQFAMIQEAYRPYKEILRLSLAETLRIFGLPYHPKDGERFASSMPRWRPFPDVSSALRRIIKRCRIVIISNTDNDILRESIQQIGVPFHGTVTAEDAKVYKPSPQIFQYALKVLGVEPQEILHAAFGFQYDIIPAQAADMRTVWINRKGENRPGPVTPDYTTRDLAGLADLLEVCEGNPK
jgi:2-haloalkanoic acid dehalogenase type II